MDSVNYGNRNWDSPLTGNYPWIGNVTGTFPWQKFYYGNNNSVTDPALPGKYHDYACHYEYLRTGLFNTSYGYDDHAHYRTTAR